MDVVSSGMDSSHTNSSIIRASDFVTATWTQKTKPDAQANVQEPLVGLTFHSLDGLANSHLH